MLVSSEYCRAKIKNSVINPMSLLKYVPPRAVKYALKVGKVFAEERS
jgi:hypothetical protein